jgi:hypothetical protein
MSAPPIPRPLGALAAPAALAALGPRFVTAGVYFAAWIVPQRLPAELVRGLFVGMILEFLLLHSYAFLNLAAGAAPRATRGERLKGALTVLGFGTFYLIMAVALSWATKSSAPAWTIAWLVGARVFEIAVAGDASAAVTDSRFASWIRHLLLYLAFAILTSIVPLPAFGLTSEVVAGLELSGSGSWVEKPQSLFAFGFLYFGLGAYFDLRSRLRR